MKIQNKFLITVLFISLAPMAIAEEGQAGMMQERREGLRGFREERRQDIQAVMEKSKEIREEFRAIKASGTMSSTTRKEFKDEARDMKKEFMDDRREDKREFMDKMKMGSSTKDFGLSIRDKFAKNATATAAIAAKLGMTSEALKMQLASGCLLYTSPSPRD
jgi:hypothetical protein